MKVGISAYSFHKCDPALSIFEILEKIKEMGATGVDFIPSLKKEGTIIDIEMAKQIRAKLDELGLDAACMCQDAEFFGDRTVEEEKNRLINERLPVAKELGCPVMRIDVTFRGLPASETNRSYERIIELVAPAFKEIAEAAEAMGIKLCTENHGRISQAADRIEKLINTVAHKNFGALVDMGNFTGVDGDHVWSVSTLAPYAFHAHAKDLFIRNGMMENPGRGYNLTKGCNYCRSTIIGHGNVPIKQCLKALNNAGYKGYVSIEFEGIEDPILGNTIGCENLTRYLKEIDAYEA